jgi:hypothetical protein
MPDDILADVKRSQEVTDRPGKTAPTPVPSGLKNEFSDASYKMAAPKQSTSKPKGETATSLDLNAQQRKVAEGQ